MCKEWVMAKASHTDGKPWQTKDSDAVVRLFSTPGVGFNPFPIFNFPCAVAEEALGDRLVIP